MWALLFFIFLYMEELLAAPDWVEMLRSGEERFKLSNGSATLFRQIGKDCEFAMLSIEKDLEREYNMLVKYTTEVVFQDDIGCAITVSVGPKVEPREMSIKNALLQKARTAQKYAYVGLTREEFVRFTKDKSPIVKNTDPNSYCARSVDTIYESIHGIVHVCWKDNIIRAYCVPKIDVCMAKKP